MLNVFTDVLHRVSKIIRLGTNDLPNKTPSEIDYLPLVDDFIRSISL
jgi:hypothetical protein